MHDFITGVLIYLNVGSLIWCFLAGVGVIDNTFARRGGSRRVMVLATLFMIVGWPIFIGRWVWGMCTT